jgi:aryl-alcohol dehydrogenase-like predicted oxidoreductase
VTSVLFGATSPAQIAENVDALEVDRGIVPQLLEL